MIRKAKPSEIESILNLSKACAKAMIASNIYQWNEHYPSREAFESDIKRDELYVFSENEKILGTIVISDLKDEIYKPVIWLTPSDSKCIYIHRLAVHPEVQGQGIAKKLMDFAENYAKERDYSSVRLDTFSKNLKNNSIYQKRGYRKLQEIFFPKQSEYPFYCYELVF